MLPDVCHWNVLEGSMEGSMEGSIEGSIGATGTFSPTPLTRVSGQADKHALDMPSAMARCHPPQPCARMARLGLGDGNPVEQVGAVAALVCCEFELKRAPRGDACM